MAQMLIVDGDHLKRLMKICRAIRSGRGATIQQIRRKVHTSRRTIFRDLNSLDKLGIEVDLGENGYKIRQGEAQCRKLLADSQIKSLNKLLNACLK